MNSRPFLIRCNPFWWSSNFLDTFASFRSATPPLWRDLVKISRIKLWHTSSFSLERTDFENVIFEKIPWAPSEDAEVTEVKQPWNTKPRKFSNENLWKLDEFQNLASATSKMTFWPQRPRKRLSEFFQKLHF